MHHNIRLASCIAAIGLAAASCTYDTIEIPASELYARQFIKEFGVYDPSHTWNCAEQATVTVRTAAPTTVKIFAKVDGSLYKFGEFQDVNGTQALSVDLPTGISEVIVRANGQTYTVSAGASLNLASRAESGVPEVSASLGARKYWKSFTGDEIKSFRDILPEHKTNLDVVTDNFTFTPTTSKFIIYPVFYNTNNSDVVGIYYRPNDTEDPSKFEHYPIYNATGNVMAGENVYGVKMSTKIVQKTMNEGEWVDLPSDLDKDEFSKMNDDLWSSYRIKHEPAADYDYEYLWWDYNTSTNQVLQLNWEGISVVNADDGTFDEKAAAWRSKGIVIEIEEGYTYGFYLYEGNNGNYFYSETRFNELLTSSANLGLRDDMKQAELDAIAQKYTTSPLPHIGIYKTTGANNEDRYVVGFEDWFEFGDYDLNDAIFFVEKLDTESIWPPFDYVDIDVEESIPSYEWIVACEDLGTTDDFDFNDVVFGVSNYTEYEDYATVTVRALAAGGTLPIYLYHTYDNKEECIGNSEFHTWFGKNSTEVVNAGEEVQYTGKSYTIKVNIGFTMSCCKTVEKDENDRSNMGGFYVKVEKSTGDVITLTAPNLDANANNAAPQMICVPHYWQWPREKNHISTAYPKFADWVADQSSHTDWHSLEYANSNFYTKRSYTDYTIPTDNSGWNTTTGGSSSGTGSGTGDGDDGDDNGGNSGGTTTSQPGIVLESTGQDKYAYTFVYKTYSLESVASAIENATKVTIYVDKSIASYYVCAKGGADDWDATFGTHYSDTYFELSTDQLATLKEMAKSTNNYIVIRYESATTYNSNITTDASPKEGFSPVVSILIE